MEKEFSINELRVLIVAEHASSQFGGEAILPLHYYRVLRKRNIPVWLLVHERSKQDLQKTFPYDDHITYITDSIFHRILWKMGCFLPHRLSNFTFGFLLRLLTQLSQRKLVKGIVAESGINVIHQPMPVSPKEPSMIFGMSVPVIIGPMNGGMDYPPSFKGMQSKLVDFTLKLGRVLAGFMNWLIPGKRRAAMLLVANERTRRVLPRGVTTNVIELVENGIDFTLWKQRKARRLKKEENIRFVYMGRLVDWKAVDLLLKSFKKASSQGSICLLILGDGPERAALEKQARDMNILGDTVDEVGKVFFSGWMAQKDCCSALNKSDVLVLPSLMECGGAVVLEAMAMSIPVVATNWGGPADYIDSNCGILVDPTSRGDLVDGFALAMQQLAESSDARLQLGVAGQKRALELFDWEVKVDRMIDYYLQVIIRNDV